MSYSQSNVFISNVDTHIVTNTRMAESERVPSPEEIIEVMSASECASLSALSQRAGDGVVALIARLDACREGELMQNFHCECCGVYICAYACLCFSEPMFA
jgi:hypothetical protein